MMRSALAAMIVFTFALTATATLSAEPNYVTYGTQIVAAQDWVGQTRDQLVKYMGTPDRVVPLSDGGQSIRFVKPMIIGRGDRAQVVEQFDVRSNGASCRPLSTACSRCSPGR